MHKNQRLINQPTVESQKRHATPSSRNLELLALFRYGERLMNTPNAVDFGF